MSANEEIFASGQYLSFLLDNETYAFNIQRVREVIDVPRITHVPRMPKHILGAINLRGGVVPVIDLSLKFGLPVKKRSVDTCIIIVELIQAGEMVVIGTLVDAIKEVLTLDKDEIEGTPKIGMRIETDYVTGIGKRDDDFIIILDINKLMFQEEYAASKETVLEQSE